MKIIYRDIKSQNIFINLNNEEVTKDNFTDADLLTADFKIGDFNISIPTITGFQKTMAGTPFFASPEMLNKQ